MNEPIVGREFYNKAIRERDEAYERIAELLNELQYARALDDDQFGEAMLAIRRASADAYRWLLLRDPSTKAVWP